MIFNLFKSKPSLKELIPDGFVDIHSHVLPGIDDGAKNIKESIELISEMKQLGFSKIITTPHTYKGLYDNTKSSIEDSYNKLIPHLDNKNILQYASEYMIHEELIEKAQNKELLTINNRYVLIEMNFISKPLGLNEILFQIQTNKYIPIIAHMERYQYFFNEKKYVHKLKNYGCKFQVNFLSLIGYYGKSVLNNANYLIKNGLVDFFASDIHNINHIRKFEKKIKISDFKNIEKILEKNVKDFS